MNNQLKNEYLELKPQANKMAALHEIHALVNKQHVLLNTSTKKKSDLFLSHNQEVISNK